MFSCGFLKLHRLRLAHLLCSPSFGAMYSLGPVNNTNIIQLNVCASSIVLCVGCSIVVMGLPSFEQIIIYSSKPTVRSWWCLWGLVSHNHCPSWSRWLFDSLWVALTGLWLHSSLLTVSWFGHNEQNIYLVHLTCFS